MSKTSQVVLGIGLIITWAVAISLGGTPWLYWVDGGLGVLSIVVGGMTPANGTRVERASGPIAFSLALFAIWIVALSIGVAQLWLAWTTFGFACVYLFAGISAASTHRLPRAETFPFRRSA